MGGCSEGLGGEVELWGWIDLRLRKVIVTIAPRNQTQNQRFQSRSPLLRASGRKPGNQEKQSRTGGRRIISRKWVVHNWVNQAIS